MARRTPVAIAIARSHPWDWTDRDPAHRTIVATVRHWGRPSVTPDAHMWESYDGAIW